MKNFIEVHQHVQSFDSASTVDEFIKRELELGTGYVTTTDHGSLSVCKTLYDKAKKADIKAILGCELYHADSNCPIIAKHGIPKIKDSYKHVYKYGHLSSHYMDYKSYLTAVKLLSNAKLENHGSEKKPIFDWNALEELGAQNTTFTSSCLVGHTGRWLKDHANIEIAEEYYQRVRSLVKPNRFFVELYPHLANRYWVQGVFISINIGDSVVQYKFYDEKKLKTNEGEITAIELCQAFNKKNNKHIILKEINNRRKWEEVKDNFIVSVEHKEEFINNECTDWSPDGDLQKSHNLFMLKMAKKYGDKILVASDSHYATPAGQLIQDIRLMSSGGNWKMPDNQPLHRKSSEEAYEFFKHSLGITLKEFEGWVDNSYEWASNFDNFKFESSPSLPKSFYAKDSLKYTMELIKKHGKMNWGDKRYTDRLTKEIELFHKNGIEDFLPYFFPFEETCELYAENGELTGPGRGSGAGVLLNYLFNITHVDPIEYKLSLDRYMTLDRILSGKWPDTDVDHGDRELLVGENGFFNKRFGENVCQLSADSTLHLRSAVKDTARSLLKEVPKDIEELTKKFEKPPQGITDKDFVFGYEDSGIREQGSIERDEALKTYIKKYPKHWEIVQQLLGLVRGRTKHASAWLIADKPISDFIPTTILTGEKCTAYTAESVESVGGVKYDYLVVKNIKDVTNALKLIRKRSEIDIPKSLIINKIKVPNCRILPHNNQLYDIYRLPQDQLVFETVSKGQTETVFQFLTDGARKWLKNFNFKKNNGNYAIDSIIQMAIFTALDRSGPLDIKIDDPDGNTINALQEYSRRLRGLKRSNGFEAFDGLIDETLDVLVFQESVQYIYQHFTGCTGAEAEIFRTSVAKKQKEKIIKAYPYFMEKATQKVGKDKAEKVWAALNTFSGYGFPKAHAVSYSIIAYACAYLKYYFPLEWWTSILSNASKDDIIEKHWKYCGHNIDMPDINSSGDNFQISGTRIQAPINMLYGIGEGAQKQICDLRPFIDIKDFVQKNEDIKKTKKSSVHRGVVYKLIVTGVMDSLFPKDIPILEKLQMFENELAEFQPKKKVLKIKKEYRELTPLNVYQVCKDVLPVYAKPLLQLLVEIKTPNITQLNIKGEIKYKYSAFRNQPLFINYLDLKAMEDNDSYLFENMYFALATYVLDARHFKYGEKKEKEACALTLDVDGNIFEVVRWPNRNSNKLPINFNVKPGQIIVAELNKYGKKYSLGEIIYVQEPFKLKDKNGEKDDEVG